MSLFNRVASGLCLVAAMAFAQPAFAGTYDTTTQGSWVGVYGEDGFILMNYLSTGDNQFQGGASTARDLIDLPSYVSGYSYSANTLQFIWEDGTTDVRAVQDPNNLAGLRKAATSFAGENYSITLNISVPTEFDIEIYALDWDNFEGRSIAVTVQGDTLPLSNAVPSTNAYTNGTWLRYHVVAPVGPLTISITDLQVGGNNVLSAIAFDNAVPEPASLSLLGLAGALLVTRRRRA